MIPFDRAASLQPVCGCCYFFFLARYISSRAAAVSCARPSRAKPCQANLNRSLNLTAQHQQAHTHTIKPIFFLFPHCGAHKNLWVVSLFRMLVMLAVLYFNASITETMAMAAAAAAAAAATIIVVVVVVNFPLRTHSVCSVWTEKKNREAKPKPANIKTKMADG